MDFVTVGAFLEIGFDDDAVSESITSGLFQPDFIAVRVSQRHTAGLRQTNFVAFVNKTVALFGAVLLKAFGGAGESPRERQTQQAVAGIEQFPAGRHIEKRFWVFPKGVAVGQEYFRTGERQASFGCLQIAQFIGCGIAALFVAWSQGVLEDGIALVKDDDVLFRCGCVGMNIGQVGCAFRQFFADAQRKAVFRVGMG